MSEWQTVLRERSLSTLQQLVDKFGAQHFPDLELRFSSVSGALVAGRRFKPEEYLKGELKGAQTMPPSTPVQVSLEIADPGPDAVNYTLSFR